jgi:hypothetical protein
MRTVPKFRSLGWALAALPAAALSHPGHGLESAPAHDWQHAAWLLAGALIAAAVARSRWRGRDARTREIR